MNWQRVRDTRGTEGIKDTAKIEKWHGNWRVGRILTGALGGLTRMTHNHDMPRKQTQRYLSVYACV